MKEQIQELIDNYKLSKLEIFNYLEELSQVDGSKLDSKENYSLKNAIIRYEEEYAWKGTFISELENLL